MRCQPRTDSPLRGQGLFLALVLVFAFPASALAQQTTDEDAARRHFQTATALYEAGDFELALSEFQAAYDARPHPTVLRNVAATQEKLRRYPDAIRTLERYLTEATGAALRTERAAIESHLVGLRSLVGRVEVVLPEAGFRIRVDGQDVGTSPLAEPVGVSLGTRTVEALREGWEPAVEHVRVDGSGALTRVELHPVARMARLNVDAAAPHAVVSVDESPPLPAPWANAVMPGRHRVRVTAPGRRASVLGVDLEPGAERSLVVQLETGGPQGMLAVDVRPTRHARATVDGLPIDLGPRSPRTVEQGLHRLVAEGPDRAPYETNIRVRANRITRVHVRLDEDRFWVSPLWGTIAAGGAAVSLGLGIVNGLRAAGAANDYRDPSTPTQDLARLYDERERYARSADFAFVVSLICGAGAAVLYYWSQQRPNSTAETSIDAIR